MEPYDKMAHHLDLDSNFEPQQRARSNTWPLPRPENYVEIKEEPCDVDSIGQVGATGPAGMMSPMGGSVSMAVPMDSMRTMSDGSCGAVTSAAAAAAAAKKNSSRRNAWGNMSYADLITQAIQSSPDQRLTLNSIYEWMVQNVPYFKDKGDSNSSAGWKVSAHSSYQHFQLTCATGHQCSALKCDAMGSEKASASTDDVDDEVVACLSRHSDNRQS